MKTKTAAIITVLVLAAFAFSSQAFAQKKIQFTTPLNKNISPITGWTREHIEEAFFVLMNGIVSSASEGGARQRIDGQRSHHGLLADELEGFRVHFLWPAHGCTAVRWENSPTRAKPPTSPDSINEAFWPAPIRKIQNTGAISKTSRNTFANARPWAGRSACRRHTFGTPSPMPKKTGRRLFVPMHEGKVLSEQLVVVQRDYERGAKKTRNAVLSGADRQESEILRRHVHRRRMVQDGKLNRIDYYNAWDSSTIT